MRIPKIEFRRITTDGRFIPEIDGLRFIAISSVVLFHIRAFLMIKGVYKTENDLTILDIIVSNGHFGVPLFFAISGFILGIPFAHQHIQNESKVNLKRYFIRRLTRIEPPYIIALILLFFANVFIIQKYAILEGIWSFLASLTYTHNFFYGKDTLPLLLMQAWSLEVEVQFYILAPMICMLYCIDIRKIRISIFLALILIFSGFDYIINTPFLSILNSLEFFLIGLLLADFKVSNHRIFDHSSNYDTLITFIAFVSIWILNTNEMNLHGFLIELLRLLCIFVFMYYTLFHYSFKFLSKKIFTNIGGMCYSIYLLHFAIIGLFGNPLIKINFSENENMKIFVYNVILIFAIITISSIYYLMIERPCMDKDWIKKLSSFMKKSHHRS